jgi:hypothetical protein
VGYDVLGANRELSGAEIELVTLERRNDRLKGALKAVDEVALAQRPGGGGHGNGPWAGVTVKGLAWGLTSQSAAAKGDGQIERLRL